MGNVVGLEEEGSYPSLFTDSSRPGKASSSSSPFFHGDSFSSSFAVPAFRPALFLFKPNLGGKKKRGK